MTIAEIEELQLVRLTAEDRAESRRLTRAQVGRDLPKFAHTEAGYQMRVGMFVVRAESIQEKRGRLHCRLSVYRKGRCVFGEDGVRLGSFIARSRIACQLERLCFPWNWNYRLGLFAWVMHEDHFTLPSCPLGEPDVDTKPQARTDAKGRLLCSAEGCDQRAVWVQLIPWCIQTEYVKATCQAHTHDEGYGIAVERLALGWDAVLSHLADKRDGTALAELVSWAAYKNPCRFMGFAGRKTRRTPYMEDRWKRRRTPVSGRLRTQVLERDAYRCRECGGWEGLEVDHITPVEEGGPTILSNLQTLCQECHDRKHAPKASRDLRQQIEAEPLWFPEVSP